MARRASVRYWRGRKGGGYFCVFQGKRYELALGPDDAPDGPTHLKALEAFQAIMKGAEIPNGAPLIVEVIDAYLTHIKKTKKQGTVEIRERSFVPFLNYQNYSLKPAEALTHMDVYRFLDEMEKPRPMQRKIHQPGRKPVMWGAGTQRNCLLGLNAAFNWAVRSGIIKKNPIFGIEKPSPSSRGGEYLIGNNKQEIEKNHQKILAAVPPNYRPLFQALKDTGARPGEIEQATAADFNAEAGTFIFHKEMTRHGERFSHKTAKRKDRIIFLSGPTLDHVQELMKQYPTGPLFRRKSGKPFQRFNVVDRFTKLQRKLKWTTLTAYSYRHTFATELLKAGMDIETLAELMGNSPLAIRMHYSHLLSDKKSLREKLERFSTL